MSDKTVAIKPHVFGSHSDLCLYCGCSSGWFTRNRGKSCPARIEGDILMPKITTPTYVVAQTGPANYWAFAGGATIEKEPEVKVKIRPLKLETGRKFR